MRAQDVWHLQHTMHNTLGATTTTPELAIPALGNGGYTNNENTTATINNNHTEYAGEKKQIATATQYRKR